MHRRDVSKRPDDAIGEKMLSILILERGAYENYEKYSYFFRWFEDNRDVKKCIWNKSVGDVESDIADDIVPQLLENIGNATEWNAYIVDEPFDGLKDLYGDFDDQTQYFMNPYERAKQDKDVIKSRFVKNEDGTNADFNHDDDPLLKLVYYLGGRGYEKKEYLEIDSLKAPKPKNIFLITPRIFENLDSQRTFLIDHIYKEKKNELIKKRNSIDKNNNENYIGDETSLIDLNEDIGLLSEFVYSSFRDRYEYPTSCIFSVVDLPKKENIQYEDGWFSLWILLFSIMFNDKILIALNREKLYSLWQNDKQKMSSKKAAYFAAFLCATPLREFFI